MMAGEFHVGGHCNEKTKRKQAACSTRRLAGVGNGITSHFTLQAYTPIALD